MKIFWRVCWQTQIIISIVYGMVSLSIYIIFGQKIPFLMLPIVMLIVFFMTILGFAFYKFFDWVEKKLDKKS